MKSLTLDCHHCHGALFNTIDFTYERDRTTDEIEHVRNPYEWMWLTMDVLYFFTHCVCVGFDKRKLFITFVMDCFSLAG